VRELERLGWLCKADGTTSPLLRFFAIPSWSALQRTTYQAGATLALRTSPTFESSQLAIAAWLRRAEVVADSMALDPYDRDRLARVAPRLVRLSRRKLPSRFIPELQDELALVGVALVLVKAPQACKASGASWLRSDGTAVVALSARHLSDDHLWFTLFHELGHLVCGHVAGVNVDMERAESGHAAGKEAEADAYASEMLLPEELRSQLMSATISKKLLLHCGVHWDIAPGIIVGQLQHCGKLPYSHFNGLKKFYQWDESALRLRK
jgi:Zn-dependent peptidase ImmA (M78 family)